MISENSYHSLKVFQFDMSRDSQRWLTFHRESRSCWHQQYSPPKAKVKDLLEQILTKSTCMCPFCQPINIITTLKSKQQNSIWYTIQCCNSNH